jgi:hypothetical protein
MADSGHFDHGDMKSRAKRLEGRNLLHMSQAFDRPSRRLAPPEAGPNDAATSEAEPHRAVRPGGLSAASLVLSRHDFLRLAASSSAAWLASVAFAASDRDGQVSDEPAARIARVIADYDGQGFHRTGTDADNRSAAWLAGLVRTAGADVSLETFKFQRVDVRRAVVRARERHIEGLPLFDGTFTGSEGVTGRLGPPMADADIVLVRLDATGISAEGQPLGDLRRSGRYRGLVIVTDGARPGLSPTNAPASEAPYGPPTIQVSSEEGPWLESLAAERTAVQLVVDAGRTMADASNVVAQVAGGDATLAPLIVMTPRSGWWQCAAERGGGLACWLEAIRAVRAARPPRTLRFIASSGHELGHLGLESFLARQPDLVARAAAWIHLGANIGAAGGRMRVQASDDAIEQLALTAMTRASIDPPSRVPRGTVPAGEARNIHIAGGRYVSVLGSSPFFHHPFDRWPMSVDLPAVTRFAAAVADLTARLAATLE